ncbi:MAG TPA: ComF family protein [Terriglobales bacterium]|nr:ComF family protein [Terriglobales bacterium]
MRRPVAARYTEQLIPLLTAARAGEREGCGRVVFSSGDLSRFRKQTPGKFWAFSALRTAAESLFATLFPSDCRLCGAPLLEISRLPVCRACLESVRPVDAATCWVCGERLFGPHPVAEDGQLRCGICRRFEPPFERACAYGAYDGSLRGLIHLLKYQHVRPAARVLGGMLAEVLAGILDDMRAEPALLVPVPLHAGKLRQRGFNQAELLARVALVRLEKDAASAGRLRLAPGVLERRRPTESQTGLTRHQRRENIHGAFRVAQPEEIAARAVVLVDDVFTTGTTVGECARLLRRSGAARVYVATVARVLKAEAGRVERDTEGSKDTLAHAARA